MFRKVFNYFNGMEKLKSEKIDYSETINLLRGLNDKVLLQGVDVDCNFIGDSIKKVAVEKVISYIEKKFKPGNHSYYVGMHEIYKKNEREKHYLDLGSGHLIKNYEKEDRLISPDTEISLEFVITNKI